MEEIPEDVIVEILLRLPVEALLRFRCVSKRWRNLIDSPNFIKSQLNLPNKPQFVMVVVFGQKLRIFYSELDSDYIENPSPNFREQPIPWRDEIFSDVSDVVGHCDGLLCCVCDTSFVVLNPFTGKRIQGRPPKRQRCRMYAWGFGYDRDSDDYKVVVLSYTWGGVLWIYSLKSGSWKNIVDFPYIHAESNGVFVNGALHWVILDEPRDPSSSASISALHLGNLEYSAIPHPMDDSENFKLGNLGVLDGDLFAIFYGYHGHVYGYDLWVMKEYGVKESWTRLGTYSDIYHPRDRLFVSYGNSLVQCQFGSFWRKLWEAEPHSSVPLGKPLVYESSLVCGRSGI